MTSAEGEEEQKEDACEDAEAWDEACTAQRLAEVEAEKQRCKEVKGKGGKLFDARQHPPHQAMPLISTLLQNALPLREAEETEQDNPLAVIPDPDDPDAKYEAPPPPPRPPPPPHQGYQPPPRQPMVGGRRGGKSGPALGSSDVRWKQKLVAQGVARSGVPLFSWEYKPGHPLGLDDGVRYQGTTAQSLLELGGQFAEAVQVGAGGWLMVDYSQLDGVNFEIA